MPKKLTTEMFIEKVRSIWGDKYDYSKTIYYKGLTDVVVGCPVHGDFKIKPQHHLQKSYCPECSKDSIREKMMTFNVTKTLSTSEWVKKAKEKHGELFDYSKTIYINARTKLIIICKQHGGQSMLPHHHIKGYGCGECGRKMINISNGNAYSQEQFIVRASKLGDYDFSETVYKNKRDKVSIICNKHGKFTTTGELILKGHGCPSCFVRSVGEKLVAKILLAQGIEYKTEKRFSDLVYKSRLRFDFYLSKYHAIIEYDGKQHFEPVKYWGGEGKFKELKIKDALKNGYCALNNIPLLRITYKDENVEEIISKFVKALKEESRQK